MRVAQSDWSCIRIDAVPEPPTAMVTSRVVVSVKRATMSVHPSTVPLEPQLVPVSGKASKRGGESESTGPSGVTSTPGQTSPGVRLVGSVTVACTVTSRAVPLRTTTKYDPAASGRCTIRVVVIAVAHRTSLEARPQGARKSARVTRSLVGPVMVRVTLRAAGSVRGSTASAVGAPVSQLNE